MWAAEYATRLERGQIEADNKIEVAFLSPPWGGIDYKSVAQTPQTGPPAPLSFPLSAVAPIHGAELFHLTRRITSNVAYYLPKNVNVEEVAALASVNAQGKREVIEMEEEWMSGKLKAVTVYFGELVVE